MTRACECVTRVAHYARHVRRGLPQRSGQTHVRMGHGGQHALVSSPEAAGEVGQGNPEGGAPELSEVWVTPDKRVTGTLLARSGVSGARLVCPVWSWGHAGSYNQAAGPPMPVCLRTGVFNGRPSGARLALRGSDTR